MLASDRISKTSINSLNIFIFITVYLTCISSILMAFFAFINDYCMLKYYKQALYSNRGLMMANFEIIYSNELNNVNTRYFILDTHTDGVWDIDFERYSWERTKYNL